MIPATTNDHSTTAMDPRQAHHDYRITAATTNSGSANDDGLQAPYPGPGAHPDPSGFSNLSQLLELAQPIHTRNLQHNATSASPSSTYYGSASPATIFSPAIKTPMDNNPNANTYHAQNSTEAAFPLFAPAPNPHPNPNTFNVHGVSRLAEFKHPFNHPGPADFFGFPPQQPQQPPSQLVTAPNSVLPTNTGISPAPVVASSQETATTAVIDNITINDLTLICPPQEAEELRDRHAQFSFDVSLQQLHLRLMWKWHTERERPSNDDLLKFHRAIRRQPGHTATKGTGSRGGAEGYTCLWPGCQKQDQPSRSDRAQEHTLLHLGLKPFGCKACGAEFTRHNELKRHDKTCKNKKAHIHTHNLSADDITLPFIVREPVPSSSRRTSFPSTPSSSTRPGHHAASSKKARRAIRGVSSDPSSGGNSPTSPLNSSSSSRPHLPIFSPFVDSTEQSHHTFFDSNSNDTNTTTITTANNNGGNLGYNGAQFQAASYPYPSYPHGAPTLPLPLPGPLPLSPSAYVTMPLPYPYGPQLPQPPQPGQRIGHPRSSPFSFPHPLHNVTQDSSSSSDPFSSPSENLDPRRSPYPGQRQQRQ